MSTAVSASSGALIAPGSQVVVRDEEWLVRSVEETRSDGFMVKVIGTSELVRDQPATFFTALDDVIPLQPEDTTLVADRTPGYRRTRLYLEALLRKMPLPLSETRLAAGHRALLDDLDYQRYPVKVALDALRPRLLIADAVGLGKTLEVGMLLTELIRRGRGDRILVVTPRHILEQFQHELWTRFAIPLVRLDSEGIQRVRQKIPATRNPFTFYRRAIISIDTLKNAGLYRHHLEGIRWDAVVIDECHNLVNSATLNNQLARVLAPRTEALILTSATPHNGKPESFAELARMLDPTAVADPKHYEANDIAHLYVRRHKSSADVAAEVGAAWAERLPPVPVPVPATSAEETVFAELGDVWLYPEFGRKPPTSGAGARLFPYTLLKAFLSSAPALAETIENRRKSLAAAGLDAPDRQAEDEALARLAALAAAVDDDASAKLAALIDTLTAIGVSRQSTTRVVVFSERHATLNWLARVVPDRLRLPADTVRVLHGGLADIAQQDIVEEFALADTPVRLLLTGDIASEGVNLHRQCHHLIHFDLPWSLITIEQRNGRIDRYGQRHRPDIRALVHTPTHPRVRGDLDVLARLLAKEYEAHRTLGDAGSLMGLHSVTDEERAIEEALAARRDLDEIVPDTPKSPFDLMLAITGGGGDPVATVDPPTLFDSDIAFVEEALREAYDDPDAALDIRREPANQLLSLVPPPDLAARLDVLPQSYLTEQKILSRLKLTADRAVAEEMLRRARERTDSLWPEVAYLCSNHPLIEWLTDKVLVAFGRNTAPVIAADVPEATFLLQGAYANRRGQPTVVEWMAIDRLPTHPSVRPMDEVLRQAGVHPGMTNPHPDAGLPALTKLVPGAVEAAKTHMATIRDSRSAALAERIGAYERRLRNWQGATEQLAIAIDNVGIRNRRHKDIAAVTSDTEALITSLATAGAPMIRPVAVLIPRP
jgi:ERCC4-related helicase